jgi:hypothetical protein
MPGPTKQPQKQVHQGGGGNENKDLKVSKPSTPSHYGKT